MADKDWFGTMRDEQYQISLDQQVAQNWADHIVVVFDKVLWISRRTDFFRYHQVRCEPISMANNNNLANMAKFSAKEVLLAVDFGLWVISLLNMRGLE